MTKVIDPIGQTFGKLTVVSRTKVEKGHIFYKCVCTCGNTLDVARNNIIRGNSSRCRDCAYTSSSLKQTTVNVKKYYPTYTSYTAMKLRCSESIRYMHVPICDRWLGDSGFINFLKDMGERPDGCTLDRIDNALGYEPANCRWATRTVQNHNKGKRRDSRLSSVGVYINKGLYVVQISKDFTKHIMTFADEKSAAIYYDNASEFLYGDRPNKTVRAAIKPSFGKIGSLHFDKKVGKYRVRFSSALGKRETVCYSESLEHAQEVFDLLESMLIEKIYFMRTPDFLKNCDLLN